MTIDEQIREQIEAIDWEAISDNNRLEAIGCELYNISETNEKIGGVDNAIAVVAAAMDGFRAHHLPKMNDGDGRAISNGFAQALMRAHIAEALDDEAETSS